MRFEFATAGRILFGCGVLREVGPAARAMGRRALVAVGCPEPLAARLFEQLRASGVDWAPLQVSAEPTIELVRRGVAIARQQDCQLVIGIGGGSALDAGKAIAALLTNRGDPLDYLEVIGRGQTLQSPAAPYIAIPTTAGTGAEVTRNAVLASPEHRVKASLRSPLMLPRLAAVDPELTLDLPPEITAATGLDALTQLIEPFVSVRANPMTDLFCLEGIARVARSLERACCDGGDVAARSDMALASLLGGLALANAGLGAVHGFAAPVGGMFEAPHGAVCAALLPHVILTNIRALHARAPDGEALARYRRVAQILTGRADVEPEDSAKWVAELSRRLRIPALAAYGITAAHTEALAEAAARASSMKGNPLPLTPEELRGILLAAL